MEQRYNVYSIIVTDINLKLCSKEACMQLALQRASYRPRWLLSLDNYCLEKASNQSQNWLWMFKISKISGGCPPDPHNLELKSFTSHIQKLVNKIAGAAYESGKCFMIIIYLQGLQKYFTNENFQFTVSRDLLNQLFCTKQGPLDWYLDDKSFHYNLILFSKNRNHQLFIYRVEEPYNESRLLFRKCYKVWIHA